MSASNNVLRGMEILLQHFDNPAGYHIGAEHEIIYVYATDKPLDAETVKELEELGWIQEDAAGDEYDPEAGWSTYVCPQPSATNAPCSC